MTGGVGIRRPARYTVTLTSSQLMALRSILISELTCEGCVYVDCSVNPPAETTSEQLLTVINAAVPS